MPKKVPSEYTGRFSVKPKKSTSRPKDDASVSPSHEKESAPLPDNLREEPASLQEKKRKLSSEDVGKGEGASLQPVDGVRRLDLYSQQLEVEHPTKKRKLQIAEQIESQDQQVALTGNLNQNEQPIHLEASNREPGTIPFPPVNHQYYLDALEILRNGWQCRDLSESDIDGVARSLADRSANVPNPETILFPRHVPRAILEFATQQPQAIDYMLRAYSEFLRLLPESLTKEHGGGTEATITQLKWLLIQSTHGFNGFLLPDSPATIDLEDHSNIKFQYAAVSSNLDAVLVQIRDWKWQRKVWFIACAMQARCFSLNIVRKKAGEQVEALIDAGLNRKQKRWSKVDMFGACLLLRGCAQSLKIHSPNSRVKIFAWKESLEKFMLQDQESWDNDFGIKAHAALALMNLIDGPFDETSEQLFARGSWVF